MSLFRHILFPVDSSARSQAVAGSVVALARRCGARLTVLHAVDLPPGAYADWYAFSAMVDVASIKELERKMLDEFLAGEQGVERALADGPAVSAVIRFAEENGVDLIMLPTHGYGRFRSLLLGSVTSGILHDAHCPVWTAAHSEVGGAPAGAEYRRILCATDLNPATPKLFDWAARLAADFGAALEVVHVLPGIADPVHSVSVAEYRESLRREANERFREWAGLAQFRGECQMISGEPGESVGTVIARKARESQADMVVAGRGVIQGTFGRLRTHVNDIIRRAPCPVLSV